jgi:hypothetical protein
MITGWITNKGKFLECGSYDHFSVDDPIIKSVWEKYEEELQEVHRMCQNLEDKEGFGEWHTYEMTHDDSTHEAMEELFNKGYLRIINYENNRIGVEGYGQWIEVHKFVLKNLADKYECRLKLFKI